MRNFSLKTKKSVAISGLFVLLSASLAMMTLGLVFGPVYLTPEARNYSFAAILTGTWTSLLLVWVLTKRMTSQLSSITHQLAAFSGSGSKRIRLQGYGGDEIGTLTHALNELLDKLEAERSALADSEASFGALAENGSSGDVVY